MKKDVLILFLFFIFLLSCEKNESFDLNPNVEANNDVVLALTSMQHVVNLLVKARCDSTVMSGTSQMIDNAYVTYNSAEKIFTFAYGHILCPDSVSRTGVVRIRCTDDLIRSGNVAVVSYDYYNEDGNVLRDNDTILTLEEDAEGCHLLYGNNNNRMQKLNGDTIVYTTRMNALITPQRSVVFTGTLKGVFSKGSEFSSEITTPLVYDQCQWPVSGIIRVDVPTAEVPTGNVDFISSDTCNYWMHYNINSISIRVRKMNAFLQ